MENEHSIFVRNVPYSATAADLENHARQFGDVVSVRIPIDRATGNPRGFAFVECATHDGALAVLRGIDGRPFQGRTLHAEPAQPKAPPAAPRGYIR